MRLLFLVIIFGVLQRLPCQAQSPSFVHYGVSEGLPSNKVYCALQDHRGFIWFGTDKGLARFDGTRFQVYGVKEGLPDPEVLLLFEDSQNRLWISCFSHRPCYMQDGKIVNGKNDSLLAKINPKSSLWWFSEDEDRNIWIAGKAHTVYVHKGKEVETIKYPEQIAQVAHVGKLRFELAGKDIYYGNPPEQRSIALFKNPAFTLASVDTQFFYSLPDELAMLEWSNGKIAVVDRINIGGGRVFPDKHRRLWLCTDTDGAIRFDISGRRLDNPERFLRGELVNAVLEDRQGALWFCTGRHGVYALFPGMAYTYKKNEGQESTNITAVARNQSKQVLAGDDAGNLYRISGQRIQITTFGDGKSHNRTRQIIPMPGDTCWVATDKGLFKQCGHQSIKVKRQGKEDFSGFKTIMAQGQTLWFGNHHSIGFLPPGQHNTVFYKQERTTALGQDNEGYVWAGRLDGLYSQADSFKYNWGNRFPILKSRVVSIQNAGGDKLWVVTPDAGLLLAKVQQGALVSVDSVNQFLRKPIENIQSMYLEPSPANRVWLATNNGVYGLDPANWKVVHFDKNDGLADNDVNCVWVAEDTLWAGTPGGLSCLPLLLQEQSPNFATFVTGLQYQLDGKLVLHSLLDSLWQPHRIVLPPDAAMVTLNLGGLNYRSQGNFEFKCITAKMLPPLRWWARHNLISWILNGFKPSTDTAIVQGNSLNYGVSLPSGAYHIQVAAITAQGVESQSPDAWVLVMRPHWYNTIWFDLLLWGIAFYILWRVLRARNAYRKLNQAVSDLQLKALQAQINPHFVGNSINAIQQFFYPPNPGAASNYIEVFTRLLRRTITLSEKHFNNFEEELAYDSDYLEMIKLRYGARFHYAIKGVETVPADLPFPSMLLQPILENATIHGLAPEGISVLTLHFSFSGNKMRCTVTDNGMGFNTSKARPATKPREHKSQGLALLEKKVSAFNALYDIELQLKISDLADARPSRTGTKVTISFLKKT